MLDRESRVADTLLNTISHAADCRVSSAAADAGFGCWRLLVDRLVRLLAVLNLLLLPLLVGCAADVLAWRFDSHRSMRPSKAGSEVVMLEIGSAAADTAEGT